ncbi:hypothetical protein ACFOE1_07535 [Agromyces mediolanus]|uniref:Uncharacterized protein n=1 Tax=Agromyces mediolanus TaxID=41986 RepID=A0A918CDB5_AGRME|nr:hypothetical protein [Agromyces mediolanus]GGR16937.1 hypothetical protein GCM10010196_07110 [Agromyces mediolanus]GLJ71677.1 hypothetical protein GCM10017583_09330 [Agromyces mediolanus]
MDLEPVITKLDRIAGGRAAGEKADDELVEHPRTRRAFTWISWLLALELLIGLAALVVAIVLFAQGTVLAFPVWMRILVVLGMTATLFYFAWRAQKGYRWAYSRLRLFSKIFPVITLVMAAIPGLFPFWMVTEQIVFSLILIGIADFLDSDHMRRVFRRPE